MANGTIAPVCPTSRDQAVSGQPGILIPTFPLAVDLPSAIAALQAINAYLRLPTIPANNIPMHAPSLINNGPNQSAGGKSPKQYWREVGRVTEQVRVHDPNDKDNWVQLTRITEVTFRDDASGQTMTYETSL